MDRPNGRKGAQRLAKLFPHNRRARARLRPLFPTHPSVTIRPSAAGCATLRVSARKSDCLDQKRAKSAARLASVSFANRAALSDGPLGRHGAPTIVGGERVAGVAGGSRLSGARLALRGLAPTRLRSRQQNRPPEGGRAQLR